jgi:hypothetical protein
MVLLGESHRRTAVQAFMLHYHEERHQGLDNELVLFVRCLACELGTLGWAFGRAFTSGARFL